MALTSIKHRFDPAEDIQTRVGRLPQVCGGRVLLATYVPPGEIDVGGGKSLYVPDKTKDEAIYQGKAHLVLALGAEAYMNDQRRTFAGPYCAVGDWVSITPNSGRMLLWNGVPCRLVEDIDVQMILESPDAIF